MAEFNKAIFTVSASETGRQMIMSDEIVSSDLSEDDEFYDPVELSSSNVPSVVAPLAESSVVEALGNDSIPSGSGNLPPQPPEEIAPETSEEAPKGEPEARPPRSKTRKARGDPKVAFPISPTTVATCSDLDGSADGGLGAGKGQFTIGEDVGEGLKLETLEGQLMGTKEEVEEKPAAVPKSSPSPQRGGGRRGMERDVMGVLVEKGKASSSLSLEDIKVDGGPSQARPDESDFFVKNLDTGEMFSIQEIESRVPQSLDPVTLRLSGPGNSHHSEERDSESAEEEAHPPPVQTSKKQKGEKKLPEKIDATEKLASRDPDFVKVSCHKKTGKQFGSLFVLQRLTHHTGAIWALKISIGGQYIASGGQDMVVRVWVLDDDPKPPNPFKEKPFRIFYGHTADVLSLSWSTNNFLLSSSMDKTVRLWHVSKAECLCVFQHVDFVTCCSFHPQDDKYFMSGSLDEKLRLWNIPGKRVVNWVETHGLITAGAFSQDGKVAMTGSYKGMCNFYETQSLNLLTSLHVHSTRGKNKRGKKITGVEVLPGGSLVLITSNDSRLRLYHTNDYSLACKFKGLENNSSQIKATVSESGKTIVCGSEDKMAYLWSTSHDSKGRRKDRSESYESFSISKTLVTVAIFAGAKMAKQIDPHFDDESVIITTNYSGVVTILANDPKRFAKLVHGAMESKDR